MFTFCYLTEVSGLWVCTAVQHVKYFFLLKFPQHNLKFKMCKLEMHIKSTNIYGFITYFFHLGMNLWISSSSYAFCDWTRNVAVGSIICAMNIYTELHSAPVIQQVWAGRNQPVNGFWYFKRLLFYHCCFFYYYFDKDMH